MMVNEVDGECDNAEDVHLKRRGGVQCRAEEEREKEPSPARREHL